MARGEKCSACPWSKGKVDVGHIYDVLRVLTTQQASKSEMATYCNPPNPGVTIPPPGPQGEITPPPPVGALFKGLP